MRVTAYYVLRSKPELLARVERECPELLPLFSEPALWTRAEGPTGGPDEWTEQLKLSFLLEVQQQKDAPPDPRFASLLDGVLGAAPWGADTFDRWWSAERFEGAEYADEVARVASVEQLRKLRGADAWRERLIGQKARAEEPEKVKKRR